MEHFSNLQLNFILEHFIQEHNAINRLTIVGPRTGGENLRIHDWGIRPNLWLRLWAASKATVYWGGQTQS